MTRGRAAARTEPSAAGGPLAMYAIGGRRATLTGRTLGSAFRPPGAISRLCSGTETATLPGPPGAEALAPSTETATSPARTTRERERRGPRVRGGNITVSRRRRWPGAGAGGPGSLRRFVSADIDRTNPSGFKPDFRDSSGISPKSCGPGERPQGAGGTLWAPVVGPAESPSRPMAPSRRPASERGAGQGPHPTGLSTPVLSNAKDVVVLLYPLRGREPTGRRVLPVLREHHGERPFRSPAPDDSPSTASAFGLGTLAVRRWWIGRASPPFSGTDAADHHRGRDRDLPGDRRPRVPALPH